MRFASIVIIIPPSIRPARELIDQLVREAAVLPLDEAGDILLTWAGSVSEGMLPNRFPDQGDTPEFNARLQSFRERRKK